jgi:hypothetical protein
MAFFFFASSYLWIISGVVVIPFFCFLLRGWRPFVVSRHCGSYPFSLSLSLCLMAMMMMIMMSIVVFIGWLHTFSTGVRFLTRFLCRSSFYFVPCVLLLLLTMPYIYIYIYILLFSLVLTHDNPLMYDNVCMYV